MLTIDNKYFDLFIKEAGKQYPYCALRKTRRMYYFKWLMVCSMGDNVPRCSTPYQAVLSSSFTKDTLKTLVMGNNCYPLPPVMEGIMDWMHTWGRRRCLRWHEKTLDMFSWYIEKKIDVGVRELIYEVIGIRVKDLINYSFGTSMILGWSTYNEWTDFFNFQYDDVGNKDFFDLSCKSIGYVASRIEEVMTSAATPLLLVVAPTVGTPSVPATPIRPTSNQSIVSP